MENIRESLAEKGCDCADWSDEKCKEVAKALEIKLPREVEIVTGKNGAQYFVTEGFTVPKYKNQKEVPGETSTAKNIYTRVESLPQLRKDINAYFGSLHADELDDDE
ncbi:hypothetical protein LCGC14_1574620 [marine sediment metagenome]|uniref:Uncharacterized protein n=1 Tax=marine sediment metagenome TaxID=412755 RepID=A0A0F9LJ01_9ZZZZ